MLTDDKIKVLIADDSSVIRKGLSEIIEKQDDMEVIGCAENGEEAIEMILRLKPDVALIDILMPLKDGFGVLEELNALGCHDISCIVISAITMDSVAKKALALGAKYYVMKPFKADFLVGRIRLICEQVGYGGEKKKNLAYFDCMAEEREMLIVENETVEHKISTILNKLSISASIKGYYYLRSSIMMVLDDEEAIIGITKRMYPDVAREYKTTASKVERAIRHAIESAWKKGGGKVYTELVGFDCKDKPTNGQFIASIAEFIRLNGGNSTKSA